MLTKKQMIAAIVASEGIEFNTNQAEKLDRADGLGLLGRDDLAQMYRKRFVSKDQEADRVAKFFDRVEDAVLRTGYAPEHFERERSELGVDYISFSDHVRTTQLRRGRRAEMKAALA